jgi:hypothetical protein
LRLAYLIRAHYRPAQLARLVNRLDDDDVSFYIHVSARTSPETYGEIRAALRDSDKVHWTPRVATYYAGFSLIRAFLLGLQQIAKSDPLPDYTIILSGQDYPLQPPHAISGFFQRHAGKSLLHHFAIPSDAHWLAENGGLDRIQYWHFERIGYRTRQLRIPFIRRRFPRGFQPYGGSAWFALTAESVRYLIDFVRQNESFVRFFRHVYIPDETFVHTILLNSPLRERVVDEVLHYIEWPGGAHPTILRRHDFPKLVASDRPFARKFDIKHDAQILDILDREVLHAP